MVKCYIIQISSNRKLSFALETIDSIERTSATHYVCMYSILDHIQNHSLKSLTNKYDH